MQDFIKQDHVYYSIISNVIKEIEIPIIYSVLVKFKDGHSEHHRGFTKLYIRDNYLYLKRDSITLCYNMNELLFYQVIEIKQEA